MATPIHSNSNPTPGASPLGTDMLARLQANAQGEAASPGAFNAWMEKHALSADKLKAGDDKKAAQPPQAKEAAARDNSSTAARLLEQALARSRQQAAAAKRQAEQAAQAAGKTTTSARPEATVAKPKAKEDASEARAEEGEAGGAKAVASSEDSALVSELTPPPDVKTDDASAMMAWLASLTHGDPTHGKKANPKSAGGGAGAADRGDAAKSGAAALDATRTDAPAGGAQAKAAPEAGAVQTPLPTTALLQAESAQSFKEELAGKAGTDTFSGLSSALGARSAPGWQTGDAVGVMRQESATLQAPVGSEAFAQALSDQLTMWVKSAADNGPMTAELHLNPAELGPIHVKISLEGSDAQVDFAAAAVETRQAIEASMSTLSTALSDVGIQLTGGDVSAQTAQQGFQQAFDQSNGSGQTPAGGRASDRADAGDPGATGRMVAAPRPGRAGGLDLYA